MMPAGNRGDDQAMNDARDPTNADATRKQLIDLFLRRTGAEVELMRRNVPALISNDTLAWQDVRFHAQRIASEADQLDLGVLGACARELARLADERFAGAKLDAAFLLGATSAIETVAIELNELFRAQPHD
jgi:hypothetical protein